MRHSVFNDFKPMSLAGFTKNTMLYSEYQPCSELCQFINCYWFSPTLYQFEVQHNYTPRRECIIPDGCIDIIFEVDKSQNTYSSSVVGMMSKPIMTLPDFSSCQIYAIRFTPIGAYCFFKNGLADFTDLVVDFKSVSQKLEKKLAEIFLSEENVCEMIQQLNRFFLHCLSEGRESPVIINSLERIFKVKGNIDVKKLAQEEYISERQLQRVFKQWIGLSPKEYMRVIRFQNTVQSILRRGHSDWTYLAMENGYHDQAHFINDFKNFSGITPTQVGK